MGTAFEKMSTTQNQIQIQQKAWTWLCFPAQIHPLKADLSAQGPLPLHIRGQSCFCR